jgi:hypothetical protein
MRKTARAALAALGLTAALALAAAPADAADSTSVQPAHVPFYVVPAATTQAQLDQLGLFNLAQQVLGDGNEFNQIVTLNKGRVQPDGAALTDANVLNPGWILVLPCAAKGSFMGVQVQWNPPPDQVPPNEVKETCPAGTGSTGSGTTNNGSTAGSGTTDNGATSAPATTTAPVKAAGAAHNHSKLLALLLRIGIDVGIGVAGLLVLFFLLRRKMLRRYMRILRWIGHLPRRYRDWRDLRALLRDPLSPGAALRALGAADRGSTWWPYAAALSVHNATVWLAGIEIPEPVEPWQPVPGDAHAWTAARSDLEALDEPSLDPGICPVIAGKLDGALIVLDLGEAHGVLVIEGDERRAAEVRAAFGEQLEGGEVMVRGGDTHPEMGRPHWAAEVNRRRAP